MKKFDWKEIWEKKGNLNTIDLKLLDGFEDTNIDSEYVARKIIKKLGIIPSDRVLEVGCGAGMIAKHISPACNYVGIDYSKSLVKKHIKILNNSVLVAEANNIPFKDNYFDKTFSFSVFHYFPNKQYAYNVLNEIKRVTKSYIFLGDLPIRSHRKEHLLFDTNELGDGMISTGFYNKDRFNVMFK